MARALYDRLFAVAGLPAIARAISFGEVRLPFPDVSVPYETFGFLPALLPLWSGRGAQQTGVWMHWFSDRVPTYVEVSVEDENSVREIARTFEQFACDIVLRSIDHSGAWLSLNSPGWRCVDAKRALQQLAVAAASADFHLLADAWSSVPHERLSGDPATAGY